MQENNFNTTVQSLFKGMDSFITTKTVVGDAVHIGETIILPLVEVSFGVGAVRSARIKRTVRPEVLAARLRRAPCWLSRMAMQNWSMSRIRTALPKFWIWHRSW